MKTTLCVILCLVLVVFSTGFSHPTPSTQTGNKIEVYFSNKLDLADLLRMKAQLSQKQIKVNYQKISL